MFKTLILAAAVAVTAAGAASAQPVDRDFHHDRTVVRHDNGLHRGWRNNGYRHGYYGHGGYGHGGYYGHGSYGHHRHWHHRGYYR